MDTLVNCLICGEIVTPGLLREKYNTHINCIKCYICNNQIDYYDDRLTFAFDVSKSLNGEIDPRIVALNLFHNRCLGV